MEVGTPPQPFQVGLDLGWTDAFLPSARCECDCPHRPSYNSSKSSTYVAIGPFAKIDYWALFGEGVSSQDTFHIGGLLISNQVFAELIRFKGDYWDRKEWDYSSLGLLCFALDSSESNLIAPSPWHNMVKQKELQRNIFSLKLSDSPDEDGEIMFGGVNHDLFIGELMSLPTTIIMMPESPGSDALIRAAFNSGWQVQPTLSLSWPWIQLPAKLSRAIDHWFVKMSLPGRAGTIDFRRRGELPDLIVHLGILGNVTLVISPWDYAVDLPGEYGQHGEPICVPLLWWELEGEAPEFILLGSLYLKGLYSVFNQDEGTISFAQLRKD